MLFHWKLISQILRLLHCTAKTFAWYLILQKQFTHEIRKVNPTQNLRLFTVICSGNLVANFTKIFHV